MRHATIQIHLLRHATIQKHILRHATIQIHILRHDTIQIHQMRHATIHIVYYSNSPNEACHYSKTSNEACHCTHCHHEVTVVTTVTGQGCTWLVYEGIRPPSPPRVPWSWFTRVFHLHHHLVYRGALSHIQWNVVFTFQRDYNHTVCECLVLINVCECLVLINTQIYTNEV